MTNSNIQYDIIDECKCGFEEFFVLLGLVDTDNPNERMYLARSLEEMVKNGLLICEYKGNRKTNLMATELLAQINLRLACDEHLNSYPECCEEYSFMSTDEALLQLSDEDKPVPKT